MGAAGSVQADAENIPEKLTEAKCRELLVEEADWTGVVPSAGLEVSAAAKFQELAVDGFVTKEQFLGEIKNHTKGLELEKIKNHVKGLESKFKDPEYFKTLEAKFIKIAAKHPEKVQPDDWKGSMVREILQLLECGPELEKTLDDQEMLNEDGDILLGTQEKESLWEIFDAGEDDAPDDVRAFIECHTLLTSNFRSSTQGLILRAVPKSELNDEELRKRAKAEKRDAKKRDEQRRAEETAAEEEKKRAAEAEAAEAIQKERDELERLQRQNTATRSAAAEVGLDILHGGLIVAQCIPGIGQAFTAAKDFLDFVRDKDLPDDVTEATYEINDIVELLKVNRTRATRHGDYRFDRALAPCLLRRSWMRFPRVLTMRSARRSKQR